MLITKHKYFHFNPFVAGDSYHFKAVAFTPSCDDDDDDVDISVVKMVIKTYYDPSSILVPLIVNI